MACSAPSILSLNPTSFKSTPSMALAPFSQTLAVPKSFNGLGFQCRSLRIAPLQKSFSSSSSSSASRRSFVANACYMRQLLTGLHYCHVNQVLHRDIKGSNLLIDNEGNLKLADFGLARSFLSDHNGNLTNRVITLWYRPLELLLGTTKYGPAVDMWSVECIFVELLNGKPILSGKNDVIMLVLCS